jgi:hypothetical protein
MRLRDQGAFYSVSVSRAEVEAFKAKWPCSGLPDRAVTFQFDKRSGDLVDIWPNRYARKFDGSAAVALSEDAQEFGRKKLESLSA